MRILLEKGRLCPGMARLLVAVFGLLACGAWAFDDVRIVTPPQSRARGPQLLAAAAGTGAETLRNVVDVMLAFDRDAQAWLEGQGTTPEDFAARQVSTMNEVLRNSSLDDDFTFRLVGAARVDVSVKSLRSTNSARFEKAFKGMEEAIAETELATEAWLGLKRARDEAGADVMMVFVNADPSSSLQARSAALSGDEETAWNDPDALAFFADRAFGFCEISSAEAEYTTIHEIGHMMGAGHCSANQVNPASISTGPQLFPYSSAYLFECGVTNSIVITNFTIMGYAFDGYGNKGFKRAPVFSSPDIVFTAEDGSTAVPGVAGVYDNARTLRNTYATVAGFRVHTVLFNAHALVVDVVGDGTVTGLPGRDVEPGERVKLVAKAAAGSRFVGWYDCPVNGEETIRTDVPACTLYMPAEEVRLRAVFEKEISEIVCDPGEYWAGEEIAPLEVRALSYLPAKVTARNLPPGLALDATAEVIRGVPSRPGAYTATLTACNTAGARLSRTVEFVIGNWRDESIALDDVYGPFTPGLPIEVQMPDGTAGCKVSGIPTGLTWKPSRRVVAGSPSRPGDYTVKFMRGSHVASATFKVDAYPQIALTASAMGEALEDGGELEVFTGVALRIPVAATGEEAEAAPVTVKVTGLPSGLKYSAARGEIYGVPSVPSPTRKGTPVASTVKVTAANKLKWKGSLQFRILVRPLPDWARGTFCGGEACGGLNGFATVTVGANGKISGKTVFGKKSASFTANGYSEVQGAGERFVLTRVFKPGGGAAVTNVLCVSSNSYTAVRGRGTVVTLTEGDGMCLDQDLLADSASGVRIVRNVQRTFDLAGVEEIGLEEGDTLRVKLGVTGAVTVSGRMGGKAVSSSSRLVPVKAGNGVLVSRAVVSLPTPGDAAEGGRMLSLVFTAAESKPGEFRLGDFEFSYAGSIDGADGFCYNESP